MKEFTKEEKNLILEFIQGKAYTKRGELLNEFRRRGFDRTPDAIHSKIRAMKKDFYSNIENTSEEKEKFSEEETNIIISIIEEGEEKSIDDLVKRCQEKGVKRSHYSLYSKILELKDEDMMKIHEDRLKKLVQKKLEIISFAKIHGKKETQKKFKISFENLTKIMESYDGTMESLKNTLGWRLILNSVEEDKSILKKASSLKYKNSKELYKILVSEYGFSRSYSEMKKMMKKIESN